MSIYGAIALFPSKNSGRLEKQKVANRNWKTVESKINFYPCNGWKTWNDYKTNWGFSEHDTKKKASLEEF